MVSEVMSLVCWETCNDPPLQLVFERDTVLTCPPSEPIEMRLPLTEKEDLPVAVATSQTSCWPFSESVMLVFLSIE